MKRVLVVLALFFAHDVAAQQIVVRDPAIASAVEGVKVDELRRTVDDLVAVGNRNNLNAKGIARTADYLCERLEEFIPASGGRLSVEKVSYKVGGEGTRLPREVELVNVVATIRGVSGHSRGAGSGMDMATMAGAGTGAGSVVGHETGRTIAVLAHFDNRGASGNDTESFVPGANDNGSGVACLVEMARALSGMELAATVKLMFLSGEEHGLHGARFMAQKAKTEGWDLVAVLNNDMIGNSNASGTGTYDNTTLRVFSEDGTSRELARYIKEVGERYVDNMGVRMILRADRFGRGGDHSPFNAQGFAAVRLCEVNENYHRTHTAVEERDGVAYGDTVEGIDFEYLRKNTGVNIASVANLASAPAEPVDVRMDVRTLENHSSLSWSGDAWGYYVLMRHTDSAQWERKFLVRGTSARLPYSKDNYFFAVQAVDSAGHESLPVAF